LAQLKCLPTVLQLFQLQGVNTLEYTNPEIPEGINTSKSHPLKEFFWLTSGVIVVIAILMLLLILLADIFTGYIPFSIEKKISFSTFNQEPVKGALPDYLQSLSNRIATAQELPDTMTITVHYLDDETVNAFATLGGHIFLFKGLLEKLPNENSLVMLLAHEIAHIKHRHPIKSIGRGIIIGLVMSALSSSGSDSISEGILGEAGYLTLMKYSRDMELEADKTAIRALNSIYGHLAGADDLFTVLQKEMTGLELPEFFSTHPLNEARVKEIKSYISTQSTLERNKITPLHKKFKQWLEPSLL